MLLFVVGAVLSPGGVAAILHGDPANYTALVKKMDPGDTLVLDPGLYRHGLTLHGLQGTNSHPIVIRGPTGARRAVFLSQPGHNTVSIANAAYVEIYNLVLDGRGLLDDAVKAEGPSRWAHHITLDGLVIYGYDADQQNVGISTKCPAWNWVVRNTIIDTAGTGMYFGWPDGSRPFFDSLIEHNVVLDTVGYNIEIKHQNRWSNLPVNGPRSKTTIIRYNVFSKARYGATGHMARPNVLTDHWPPSGRGKNDTYLIYGNLFYENPTERLFQGEGNIALYDNLFVNDYGDAVSLQRHHGPLKRIFVFNNTIVARGLGIGLHGTDPGYPQKVFANAVFAAVPLHGGKRWDNVTAGYNRADEYLINPSGKLVDAAAMKVDLIRLRVRREILLEKGVSSSSRRLKEVNAAIRRAEKRWKARKSAVPKDEALDLFPRAGRLVAAPVDKAAYPRGVVDALRDFNGTVRDRRFRGAYAGEGENPGWRLRLGRMPARRSDR